MVVHLIDKNSKSEELLGTVELNLADYADLNSKIKEKFKISPFMSTLNPDSFIDIEIDISITQEGSDMQQNQGQQLNR